MESIAASRLPVSVEWEVLVVDNNSNDQTREVVEDFCRRYPGRFRYQFEPRQGLSNARNAGVSKARGKVLAFTDDDVRVEPDWLNNLTFELTKGEWAGAGGKIIPVWQCKFPAWLSADDPDSMGPFVAFDLGIHSGPLTRPPYGANMAFLKEMFEKFGGFRTDLGRSGANLQGREDIEFANRLFAGGERLRYEPFAVVYHPTPESRMKQGFVLRWWFSYGQSEVADLGPPSGGRWCVTGVPVYLIRRLIRWTVQWWISIGARQRFSSKRRVWYLAGIILACYQWKRSQPAPICVTGKKSSEDSEKTLSQT